ncbi:DUF6503 family protein [Longimonas halophila]|nr:DUF6503 family protein [Longimonas halophila]
MSHRAAACWFWGIRSAAAFLVAGLLVVGGSGCTASAPDPATNMEAYLDTVIAAHGGDRLDRAVVTFTFRGDAFTLRRNDGQFRYERATTDSLGRSVVEGLTNTDVYRVVEGDTLTLSPDEQSTVATAVNSVAYFALLPYPLQDPSVQATYAGPDTIQNTAYHRVAVSFDEGGGKDYEDVFLYWFAQDTHAMDYLAYAFGVGGPPEDQGTRFREAFNVRTVNGVRWADYHNYRDAALGPDALSAYPQAWTDGAVERVSTVALRDISVRPLAP